MVGKKNVVFGFLFLVFTAALGALMVNMGEDVGAALQQKQVDVGRLAQLQDSEFEEELEPLDAGQIARANTAGILALNKLHNTQIAIDRIKGGAHTHGNLESLLNIVVGIALGFIAVASWMKQIVSWLFIIGTLLHSGALYLGVVFDQGWALQVLQTGIGPGMILVGLLAMALLAAKGFRNEWARD